MSESTGSFYIDTLRRQIDELDASITALVDRRSKVSRSLQNVRVSSGESRVDLGRERDIIAHYVDELGIHGRDVADSMLAYCRGRLTDAADCERQG